MLTSKLVNVYGIVGVVVMCALLALVWFRLVPEWTYIPLFIVALVLVLGRVVLRIMLARQQRESENDQGSE